MGNFKRYSCMKVLGKKIKIQKNLILESVNFKFLKRNRKGKSEIIR